jgi:adenylate kinase family enzyme
VVPSPIGQRIHVIGNTCTGKSTLAAELARAVGAPAVELDALNWLPGWIGLNETDPAAFERRIAEATAGAGFVVAGSYESFSQKVFWPRLETVVWLDLPLRVILPRVLRRSWRRSRSGELLWGTNRERFWPQLRVWSHDSLLWWAMTQQQRKRRRMLACMADPRFAHIRFVRLTSGREVEAFRRDVVTACGSRSPDAGAGPAAPCGRGERLRARVPLDEDGTP